MLKFIISYLYLNHKFNLQLILMIKNYYIEISPILKTNLLFFKFIFLIIFKMNYSQNKFNYGF